jgi:hypothetical protein
MIVEFTKSVDNEGKRGGTTFQDKELDRIDASSLVCMMGIKSATA